MNIAQGSLGLRILAMPTSSAPSLNTPCTVFPLGHSVKLVSDCLMFPSACALPCQRLGPATPLPWIQLFSLHTWEPSSGTTSLENLFYSSPFPLLPFLGLASIQFFISSVNKYLLTVCSLLGTGTDQTLQCVLNKWMKTEQCVQRKVPAFTKVRILTKI